MQFGVRAHAADVADPAELSRLRSAAEACKVRLSSGGADEASVEVAAAPGSRLPGTLTLSRAELTAACAPVLHDLSAALERFARENSFALGDPARAIPGAGGGQAAHGASLSTPVDRYAPPPRRVTRLVLAGGATRSPLVRALAEQRCGLAAASGADPERCVAIGAAVHAGTMEGSVRGALELADSWFSRDLHGRASGFQM